MHTRWWSWFGRSLYRRIVLPLVGLMTLTLLVSITTFILGTHHARDRLLAYEAALDADHIAQTLRTRTNDVETAAQLFAQEPAVLRALDAPEVSLLDARALVFRDRFQLDVVQVFDQTSTPLINQAISGLMQPLEPLASQSSASTFLVQQQHNRMLLVQHIVLDGSGSIVVGLDLQQELERIAQQQRLPDGLALTINKQRIVAPATQATAADVYVYQQPLTLGSTTFTLEVLHSTKDLTTVLHAGLRTMLITLLGATVLLLLLGMVLAHSIVRPVRRLARVAEDLAAGDLSKRATIESHDELGSLALSLNTAAERLVEALREQRREMQRERAILASIADGVLVSDEAGRIVVMNEAAYHIIGVAEAERLQRAAEQGAEVHQFYAALEALEPFFAHALGQKRNPLLPSQLELAGRTFQVHARPIWLNDTLLGAVTSLHDVSAQVESERIKSEFIAVAAHELRAPLTSMRGFIDLLRFTDTSNLSAEQLKCIEIVERGMERLQELISDLLDISRLDHQQTTVKAQPLDLCHHIHESVQLFRQQLNDKQQTCVVRCTPQLPHLRLDPVHLQRMLINLLSNAVKYTPDGGAITIRCTQRANDILVQIQDTGVGIPLADQPRIFGRFFRAKNPLSAQVGGTGLGLAITKSLIELNHGSIYFESTPNIGTTFYMSFPCELIVSTPITPIIVHEVS